MGDHRHPSNVRRSRTTEPVYTILEDEPETTTTPATPPTTQPIRRLATAGALAGVLATAGAASGPLAEDEPLAVTGPIPVARVLDVAPAPDTEIADRLGELAASRATRDAEQAHAAEVQAAADQAEADRRAAEQERAAQEAQEAAEKARRDEEAAARSQAAQEAPRTPGGTTESAPAGAADVNAADAGSAAAIAVQTALAQRGKPYVWGATGPSTFDCSGLVLYAYKAAGISLPRVSRDQATAGVAVSRANIQPGDLVAFYSPVTHIGIYIGNGQVVHAPEPGDVVKVSSIDAFGYIAAIRRVG